MQAVSDKPTIAPIKAVTDRRRNAGICPTIMIIQSSLAMSVLELAYFGATELDVFVAAALPRLTRRTTPNEGINDG
jgi:hypothetical protein